MAPRTKKAASTDPKVDFSGVAKVIEPVEFDKFMEKSFLSYSYMVILSRAIPDARDGLKPVQRRVLYTMIRNGWTPDKNHVKSARVTGEVMGRLHPHGSSYLTLVRLNLPYVQNVPLIDGHGNFGSGPGDAPASERYTEARLSTAALMMLEEVKEDSVPMMLNYDGTMEEPTVLPAQFPNLLVNGSKGIAVGMACNLPTHNPDEVIAAARYLLKHPNASTEKLMEFVPGPDFPTAALIIGTDAIKEAYETGRGTIKIRARHEIESMGRGKSRIIFTEMPYETPIESVIEEIKKKLGENKLQGIADAKDLTDRTNGIRFIVETKAGINPDALAQELFNATSLEVSFGINNTIINPDGEPETAGLKRLLQIFLDHRIDVVRKRTEFRLEKKRDRLHHIEGLLKVLLDIDKAIKIIRNAADATIAQAQLMKAFKMDEVQATYVLNLQLRRLTKFDQEELNEEKDRLLAEIKPLEAMLSDEEILKKAIGDELGAVGKKISTERRSEIVGVSLAEHIAEAKAVVKSSSLEVADEPCIVSLTRDGKVVRGDKAARNAVSTASTTTRGRFLVVTDSGRAMRIEALHVGEKAHALASILPEPLARDEKVLAVSPLELEDGKVGGLVLGTSNGIVKVQDAKWPKTQDVFPVITLDEGAKVLGARWVPDNTAYDFVFIASTSNMLRSPLDKIRPQGSGTAGGVSGFKFAEEDTILEFAVVSTEEIEAGALVVSVSDAGNAKFTPLKNYPQKGRGGAGVRTYKMLKGETTVAYSEIALGAPVLVDADGNKLDPLPTDERRDGSGKPLGGVPVR